jgi:hypothetical protein
MAFSTDGSVLEIGVKNEHETFHVMKELGLLTENAVLAGGPQNKADIVDVKKPYTLKHKKYINVGGFAWFGTSQVGSLAQDFFDEFLDEANEVAQSDARVGVRKLQYFEDLFVEAATTVFECLPSKCLVDFLEDKFIGRNKTMKCVITESGKRKLYVFDFEEHPAAKKLREGWVPTFSYGAAKSARIVFTKGGDSVDSGLRLRFTSPHSIKGFLGLKKNSGGRKLSNKLEIRLQQDAVHKLIESVPYEVYSY